MSNSNRQEYIQELKKQIDSKPSKLQEYQNKLNEREIYGNNNFFDDFGRPGGGAPLRRNDGTVQTTRRTMLNDNYEELMINNNNNSNLLNDINNQYNQFLQNYQQQTPNPQNQIYNNNVIPQQINPMQNYYQQNMNKTPNYNINNNLDNFSNNMMSNNNLNNINTGMSIMNNNMNNYNNSANMSFRQHPHSAIGKSPLQSNLNNYYSNNDMNMTMRQTPNNYSHNYNNNYSNNYNNNYSNNYNNNNYNNSFTSSYQNEIIPISNGNNYNEYSLNNNRILGYSPKGRKNMPETLKNNNEEEKSEYPSIIPREKEVSQDRLTIQKRMLREEWIKQIEEKKMREKMQKQIEIQKDLEEEEKYNKQLAEQRRLDELTKQRRQEEMNNVNNFNREMANNNQNNQENISEDNIQNMQRKSTLVRNTPPIRTSNRAMNSSSLNMSQINGDMNSNNNNEEMDNNMNSINMDNNNNFDNNNSTHLIEQNFQMLQNNNMMNNPNIDNRNNLIINKQMNNYEQEIDRKYASISRTLDDNINEQIQRLRGDINSQYVDMSNLFSKLKMDVVEANQLKNEAERELNYIKDELLKTKMNNILYENKLNLVLEKNAPYNNLHIPFNEVDPMKDINDRKFNLGNNNRNLKSSSSLVYANDMVNEENINIIRDKMNNLNTLSKAGLDLVGESEFIPIQSNSAGTGNDAKNMMYYSKGNEGTAINGSFGVNNINGNNTEVNTNNMDYKVLENRGELEPMYKILDDIAKINHDMNYENKTKTLAKNLEEDYKNFK